MAERKAAKKRMHKVAESSTVAGKNRQGFTDEGHMWPTAFALKELTTAEEARIAALVKKAVS